jgi:hypothetical protein
MKHFLPIRHAVPNKRMQANGRRCLIFDVSPHRAMYGIPANLDLSKFRATTLSQICLGEYQIQFHFHPEGSIYVEGRWELRDLTGTLVDESTEMNAERDALRLHVILGKVVESYSISAPDSFALRFESGHSLTVFDSSKQYESFSIQPFADGLTGVVVV